MDPVEQLDLVEKVSTLLKDISAKALPDRESRIHLGTFREGQLTLRVDRMKKPERLIVTAGNVKKLDISFGTIRHLNPSYLTEVRNKLQEFILTLDN